MFRGAIPRHIQQIMSEYVSGWPCSDIYVGCAGNFTVERVLAAQGKFRLHSNDVTLYSSILGAYLAGQEFRLALRPDAPAELAFMGAHLDSREAALASVMLATNLAGGMTSQGEWKRNNPYYERILKAYSAQWPDLHARTVERIQANTVWIDSYTCGDVVGWVEDLLAGHADQGFIVYPPFAGVGASEQYQRDSAKLEFLFDWDKPSYEPFTEESRLAFIRNVARFRCWVVGSNREITDLDEHLQSVTQLTNRGTKIFLYTNSGRPRVITPRQDTVPVLVPRLAPGEEVGGEMALAVLDYREFQTLRSEYMNIGIRPGAASLAVGVLVDGKLIGVYAFSTAPTSGSMADPSRIYMLSDFPVEPTDYPRLSKLVLYAALSHESRLLAERVARRRVRTILTTAYSNNPVSMKYRGLFQLHSRRENPTQHAAWGANIDLETNSYYQRPYQLNYLADAGQWSLVEGLALWKKKHGKREPHAHARDND